MMKLPAVIKKTALGRSSIYEGIRKRIFPAPVATGVRARAWIEDEIDAWLEARIAERDVGEKPPPPPARNPERIDERGKAKPPPKPAARQSSARNGPALKHGDERPHSAISKRFD
jgi:prophage regulatory protein